MLCYPIYEYEWFSGLTGSLKSNVLLFQFKWFLKMKLRFKHIYIYMGVCVCLCIIVKIILNISKVERLQQNIIATIRGVATFPPFVRKPTTLKPWYEPSPPRGLTQCQISCNSVQYKFTYISAIHFYLYRWWKIE